MTIRVHATNGTFQDYPAANNWHAYGDGDLEISDEQRVPSRVHALWRAAYWTRVEDLDVAFPLLMVEPPRDEESLMTEPPSGAGSDD